MSTFLFIIIIIISVYYNDLPFLPSHHRSFHFISFLFTVCITFKQSSASASSAFPLLNRYLLSYIQSFLVLEAFEYLPGSEVRNEEVPVDALSTYDILARAR